MATRGHHHQAIYYHVIQISSMMRYHHDDHQLAGTGPAQIMNASTCPRSMYTIIWIEVLFHSNADYQTWQGTRGEDSAPCTMVVVSVGRQEWPTWLFLSCVPQGPLSPPTGISSRVMYCTMMGGAQFPRQCMH